MGVVLCFKMTTSSSMKVLFLLLLSILLRKCVPCPSFTSSVEEGRAVCPGEELTYTCTIDGTGSSITVWRMTPQPCAGGGVGLSHSNTLGDPIECGPFSAQLTASDCVCYTSTLTVTASPELNGTVVTCENITGNVAGSATINIETGMLELVVTPTYENSELKKIMTTWNAICSPMTEYSITVDCGTPVYISLPLAECPGGTCVSEVNITSGATRDCTVSVSAAGLSNQTTVSLKDEYHGVLIIADNDPTVVTHSFQTGFPGVACFSIEFTFMDEAELLVNMAKSTSVCRGESTDTLEVSIPPATEYSFVARTFDCGCGPGQFQQSVIIEGTGTTGGCFVAQLFGGNINETCPDDGDCNGGGCVKYTAPLSPGDSVTYESCDGYILEGSDILTCLPSGQWSGSPPTGVPAGQSIFNIVVIILIVVAVLLLLIAITFMVCFIIYYCEAKNLKKVAGEQRLGSPSELKTY